MTHSDYKRALLAEWEQKRDELDHMIQALRSELGICGDSSQAPMSATKSQAQPTLFASIRVQDFIQPGEFLGKTQVDSVREFLYRVRRPARLSEIAAALYHAKAIASPLAAKDLETLSDTLSCAADLVSIGEDRWALAAWYPAAELKKMRRRNSDSEERGLQGIPRDENREKVSTN